MPSSFNAALNVTLNPASLNASTKQIKQALGRITGQASEFQKSLDASTARVLAFGATTAVLNGVTQSFKKLVSTTVEVQKKLIEINSIFQATEATFNRFRASIFQVAKDTGQSFNTVADGAAELARQGLSAEETAKRLKAALILTRISGLDAEKSVKALTAAINGFQSASLSANEIVNKMVAVDTAFAVSAQDLAEAFSRAGSTAEDAGVSFNELLGLVTAVEQKTARGGAVIGNAFKSIFTRLSRGTTIESLKELGVQIDATQTGIQKLQALSNAIENIADPTVVSKIKELAGGVFQINVVSAALKDLTSETSVFAGATDKAANATNEAFEKNKALSESIAHNMNQLIVGITSLAEKIGSLTFGPVLENLIGIATKFTEFLDKALDPEKGNAFIKGFFKAIGAFLSGPALVIFTVAFVKITKLIAKFAVEGLATLFKMGTQTEKIKQLEGGIVALLAKDAKLRKVLTSTTATQAQKEKAVIAAIRRENNLLREQANLRRSLASLAWSGGVRGFGDAGFRGRGGRRFSGGFRAEEAEARMLGAPAGVRARMSEGTIGGRKFIMNNHETEIPNFAGRDSAVIPHYSRGFIPNYARPRFRTDDSSAVIQRRLDKGEYDDDDAELATALLAKRKKGKKRMRLSGSGKAMLIPRLNRESQIAKNTTGSFKKGGRSYPYILTSKLNIRGPKLPQSADKVSDPQDEQLRPNIAKKVAEEAAKFAGTLYPVTGRKINSSKIMRQLLKQGGGKGALHAIIGAAFEAAIMAGLNISPAKRTDGGDFDVRGSSQNNLEDIQMLFGLGSTTNLMDFKASASSTGVASFMKKIANEKYRNNTAAMNRAVGRKAAGYIPNFNALMGYGVPDSKIRVHRDSMGEPLAVTNTRDEPRGLQDAVNRERAGIGMHSRGFVPNYFVGSLGRGAFKWIKGFGKSGKKAKKGLDDVAEGGGKSGMALTAMSTMWFAGSMAMGTVEEKYQAQIAALAASTDATIEALVAKEKETMATKQYTGDILKLTNKIHEARLLGTTGEDYRVGGTGANERSGLQKLNKTVLDLMPWIGVGAGLGGLGMARRRGRAGGGGGGGPARLSPWASRGERRMHHYRRGIDRGMSPADANRFAGRRSRGFGGGGTRAGGAVGAALSTILLYKEISDIDKSDMSRAQKKEARGGAVGGVVGGVAGGALGTIGAAALTGTAIGGPIGLIAGLIVGGIAAAIGSAVGAHAAGKDAREERRRGAVDDEHVSVLDKIQTRRKESLEGMGFTDVTATGTSTQFQERFRKAGGTAEFAQKLADAEMKEQLAESEFTAAKAVLDNAIKELEESGDKDAEVDPNIRQRHRDAELKRNVAKRQADNLLQQGAALRRNVGRDFLGRLRDGDEGFGEEDPRTGEERKFKRHSRFTLTGRGSKKELTDTEFTDVTDKMISEANKKLAAANERLAQVRAKLAKQEEKAITTAEQHSRNAQMRGQMGKMTTLMGWDEDQADVFQHQLAMEEIVAANDVFAVKNQEAKRQSKMSELDFFASRDLGKVGSQKFQRMRDDALRGQDVSDELTDRDGAPDPQLKKTFEDYMKLMDENQNKVKTAGDNFRRSVENSWLSLRQTENDIEAMKLENTKAQTELWGASIDASINAMKNIFSGDGPDMQFMSEQVREITDELNRKGGPRAEVLGSMIADFDDQGLGVDLKELIKQLDPKWTGEKLAKVFQDAITGKFQEGVKGGRGRTQAEKDHSKIAAQVTKDYLESEGIDIKEPMKKLQKAAAKMGTKLEETGAALGELNKLGGKEFVDKMEGMFLTLKNAGENVNKFSKKFDTGAEQEKLDMAQIITANAEFLTLAKTTLDEAKVELEEARKEIRRASGKGP